MPSNPHSFGDAHPLSAIERGSGLRRVFGSSSAQAGAAAGECVHSEMNEEGHFIFLPGKLSRRGDGVQLTAAGPPGKEI